MATNELEKNIVQAISDFDDIKAAIKEKGVDVPYGTDTSEYGNLIRNLPSDYDKAYNEGYEAGNADGYESGYDKGTIDGKKAEYDFFWDTFQRNGVRTSYYASFRDWKGGLFRPKYDIKTSTAYQMFAYFDEFAEVDERIDLVERLAELGVTLDFSNASTLQYAFWNARIARVGVVNATHKSVTGFSQTFDGYLGRTIDKFILKSDGSQTFSNTFRSAGNLVNLTIEGVIGKNGFNVSWSKHLTHESLMSIINALQDKTADTSGTTWLVTLGAENVAKLTTEELNIIESKGWTYG